LTPAYEVVNDTQSAVVVSFCKNLTCTRTFAKPLTLLPTRSKTIGFDPGLGGVVSVQTVTVQAWRRCLPIGTDSSQETYLVSEAVACDAAHLPDFRPDLN
jgi:hypothetical protein